MLEERMLLLEQLASTTILIIKKVIGLGIIKLLPNMELVMSAEPELGKQMIVSKFNSLISKENFHNWSYSFFANIRTQFTTGYDYLNILKRPQPQTSSLLGMLL